MAQSSIVQLLQLAAQYQQAGRRSEAEAVCRKILVQDHENPSALHLLGVMAGQHGEGAASIAYLRRAIVKRPAEAMLHGTLGNALASIGETEAAIAAYSEAIRLRADYPEAHYNLGSILHKIGRISEGIKAYRRAIELRPNYIIAYLNLGKALKDIGRLDEAEASLLRVVQLAPDFPDAYNNLGIIFDYQLKFDQAIAAFQKALHLRPNYAHAWSNMGNSLQSIGRIDEAVMAFQRAIELSPNEANVYNNLGNAYKDRGQIDEAVAAYRQALEADPDHAAAQCNLLYLIHFHPAYNSQMILQEHLKWNSRFAKPLTRDIRPHTNDRTLGRRLRVGYVSPDFRLHAVGRFVLPLLASHDRDTFDIFCYSDVLVPDAFTERLKADTPNWRSITGRPDAEVAEQIRADKIDILVDLTMHMAGNRLLLFARKPAPVQVTYLAYCSTTGLETMDYRFTDPALDPPGTDAPCYCEKSIHLDTYWCYAAPVEAGPITPLPAITNQCITFGNFNNFCKVSDRALTAWCQLLMRVPNSRLLLHANWGFHRGAIHRRLAELNIDPMRCEFVPSAPLPDYFRFYDRIDIALDPFPYAGGTTTCDALYMGVPVITLAGKMAVGRGGVSILKNMSFSDLIACDDASYVETAIVLATDIDRLVHLRSTLRERMKSSTLMNAARFARNVEEKYRDMWTIWCTRTSAL